MEDGSLGHGRFSWLLVKALSGDAYRPGERSLVAGEVFRYIRRGFASRGDGAASSWQRQSPQQMTIFEPDFSLATREAAADQAPASAPDHPAGGATIDALLADIAREYAPISSNELTSYASKHGLPLGGRSRPRRKRWAPFWPAAP